MEGMRVVFDLDGTLIDSAPDIQQAVNMALAELGLAPLDLKAVTGFIGNGLPVLAGLVRQARNVTEAPAPFEARVRVHYDRISATSGRMFPGAKEMLKRLKTAGGKLGLCTNKPYDAVLAVLAHQGLEGLFGAIQGGDSLPERKPDPAPLLAVLDALGPGPAVYVGDSEVDAETAARAGVAFVLFTEGYRKQPVEALPHDGQFADFAELPELAQRLARQF
jgi:phosphoglycolate phosphatase